MTSINDSELSKDKSELMTNLKRANNKTKELSSNSLLRSHMTMMNKRKVPLIKFLKQEVFKPEKIPSSGGVILYHKKPINKKLNGSL